MAGTRGEEEPPLNPDIIVNNQETFGAERLLTKVIPVSLC